MMTLLRRSEVRGSRGRTRGVAVTALAVLAVVAGATGILGMLVSVPAEGALRAEGSVFDAAYSFAAFLSKKADLVEENRELRRRLADHAGQQALVEALAADLNALAVRAGAGAPADESVLWVPILAKPPLSNADTLIISAGLDDGIAAGELVVSPSGVAVGIIEETFPRTSRVTLFSRAGTRTMLELSGSRVPVAAVGRGGGSIEIIVPKDLDADVDETVALPGPPRRVVGTIAAIGSPTASSLKALFVRSFANTSELGYVGVSLPR